MRLLRTVREMLKPDGVLILGLPNARRRFRAEQRSAAPLVRAGELEPGDVLYTRGGGADEIRLFYHLFSPSEARHDLSAAGFRNREHRARESAARECRRRQAAARPARRPGVPVRARGRRLRISHSEQTSAPGRSVSATGHARPRRRR